MVAENVEAVLLQEDQLELQFEGAIELQDLIIVDNKGGEVQIELLGPAAHGKSWTMTFLEKAIPLHYGWWVIVASGIAFVSMAWGSTYGIGFFTEFWLQDLEISRTQLSFSWSLALIGTAVSLPVVGRAMDRFGPRLVLLSAIIPYALSYYILAYVKNPMLLPFVFYVVRLGMETVGLVASVTVNQWWSAKRGRSMSVAMGIGGFGLAFPSFLKSVVSPDHWRDSFLLLSGVLLVMLFLCALLVVNRPEFYGKYSDGWLTLSMATAQEKAGMDWTWREALKAPVFWVVSLSSCVVAFFWSGFNFHFVSICFDHGLSLSDASAIFLSCTVCNISSLIGAGFYYDWLKNKLYFQATCMLVGGAALLMCLVMSNTYMAIVFGGLFGIMDALAIGPPLIIAHLFGRVALGTLSSIRTGMGIASIGLGAIGFGLCRDIFGTYSGILLTLGVLCILFFVLLLVLKSPVHPDLTKAQLPIIEAEVPLSAVTGT